MKAYKITFDGATQNYVACGYSILQAIQAFRDTFPEYADKCLTAIGI